MIMDFQDLNLPESKKYKLALINSLCNGVSEEHSKKLFDLFTYIIDNKSHLFDLDIMKLELYPSSDLSNSEEIKDLVLPAVKRVYGNIFISPPTLFSGQRLELLQLYFNIDEFINYLIDMLVKVKLKKCLDIFEHIDRAPEIVRLIVDNYIGILVSRVKDCKNIKEEIRDLKIGTIFDRDEL